MRHIGHIVVLPTVLALTLSGAAAAAETYPTKPIRLIAPSSPGSGVDIVARFFGQKLSENLKQQVVVDNRAGAGANLGAEIAAHAAPDGYTLFVGTPAHAINPALYTRLTYDIVKDFAPISMLTTGQYVLVVNPSVPAKSVQELIAMAKARPGTINFASAGSGNATHLAGELFKSLAKVDVVHVPYKGTVQPLIDMVAGQIQVLSTTTVSADAQIKAGRIKVLAVQAKKRTAVMPHIPTLEEQGIRNAEAIVWFGMSAPAKTARPILDKLNREVNKALQLADVRQRLDQLGLEVEGGTAEKFDAFIKSEAARLTQLIRAGALLVE